LDRSHRTYEMPQPEPF